MNLTNLPINLIWTSTLTPLSPADVLRIAAMIEPHINPRTLDDLHNLYKPIPSPPPSPRDPLHKRQPAKPVLALSLSNQYEVDKAIHSGALIIHLQRSCQSLHTSRARATSGLRRLHLSQLFATTSALGCILTASYVRLARPRGGFLGLPEAARRWTHDRIKQELSNGPLAEIPLPFARGRTVSTPRKVLILGGAVAVLASTIVLAVQLARRYRADYTHLEIEDVDDVTGEVVKEHFLVRNDALRRPIGVRSVLLERAPFYAGVMGTAMWTGRKVAEWVDAVW